MQDLSSAQTHHQNSDSTAEQRPSAVLASPIRCSMCLQHTSARIGLSPCGETLLDALGHRFGGGSGLEISVWIGENALRCRRRKSDDVAV